MESPLIEQGFDDPFGAPRSQRPPQHALAFDTNGTGYAPSPRRTTARVDVVRAREIFDTVGKKDVC